MDRFIAEKLREGLRLLTRARTIFAEHDERDGLGLCAMLIGAVYRSFENFDLALKILWEAFELLRASGRYPIYLAATANSLANIELDLGDLDEAHRMFDVAYEESTRADDFCFASTVCRAWRASICANSVRRLPRRCFSSPWSSPSSTSIHPRSRIR
jgi:tetratricopeptide (TPR) repeat protein